MNQVSVKQDLAKREVEGAIAMKTAPVWGTENLDAADILIPRIQLAQAMSVAAQEGEVKPGEIYRSTNTEVLASVGKRLSFIILNTGKSWRVSEEGRTGQWEYRRREAYTADNAKNPWEYEDKSSSGKGTSSWKRDIELNAYVLLINDVAKELKAKSPDDVLFPCLITFSRTSFRSAGKQLMTHIAKAAHLGKPPASWVFNIGSKQEESGSNKYFVFDISPKTERESTKEELALAKHWYEIVKTSAAVKVDQNEDVEVIPVRDDSFDKAVNDTF